MFGNSLFRKSSVSFSAKAHKNKRLGRKPKARPVAEQLECRVTPAAFTPGDLVIYQTGNAAQNGTTPITSAATQVFLDEYTPGGTFVQAVALPAATSGANNPLTASGQATSEGLISLSPNESSVVLTGYGALPGLAGIAGTASTTTPVAITGATNVSPIVITSASSPADGAQVTITGVGGDIAANGVWWAHKLTTTTFSLFQDAGFTIPVTGNGTYTAATGTWTSATLRVIGIVGPDGSVDTQTTTTAFSGNNPRAAASDVVNGVTRIWADGAATGVVLLTPDTANGAGTVISTTVTNLRAMEIVGGQLYVSSGSGNFKGVNSVGTGEPTTTSQAATLQVADALGNPYQFFFARLGTGPTFNPAGVGQGYDTVYVADNTGNPTTGTPGGIQKYSYNGTAWTLTGNITTANAIAGLTGVVSGNTVTIYTASGATGGTSQTSFLYTWSDTAGFNSVTGDATSATQLFSVTDAALRGIVSSPDDGPGVFGGFSGTTPYTTNQPALQINASATFSGSSAFNGGSLTVHLATGGTASDALAVGALGNITLSGSNVLDSGIQIGIVSGGAAGGDLVITFDSVVNTAGSGGTEVTVTGAQVQDLLQAITFGTSGAAGPRSVSFTVVKNGGVDSSSASQSVNVTAAAVPAVDNPSATSVTSSGATLNATLENTGGATITDYGFFYEAGSTIDGNATKVDLGPGSPGTSPVSFLANITGLTSTTLYTFEGYATNVSGTGFTSLTNFTTQGAPTVNSPTATGIHATAATLGGNIASTNGAAITDHGIVYSTSATTPPMIGNGATQISLGAGPAGVFTTTVTGLSVSTAYFYSAYAINSFGTTYSPVGTFTTLANPTITKNTLAAATNGAFAITPSTLSVADPDSGETETYTVTALPTGGVLKLSGNPLAVNGTFTQANINSGLVSYSAGGSASNDSFTFTLSNGVGGSVGATTFNIHAVAPQAFHTGDLLVYRVGDGFGSLVSSGAEVFLDEYTPKGALVQSIPVSDSGITPLISSGTATSEGLISASANGGEVVLTGYEAGLATQPSSVAGSTSASVPRAVGVLSSTGSVDLSTTTTQFSANNPRSATADGSTIWITGANSGVITTPQGGSGLGTVVSALPNSNLRVIQIFNGQLYYSTGSGTNPGIWSVGTGEPTSTGVVAAQLPGMKTSSPYGFFFANLGSGHSFNGFDTLYVADDGGTTGIEKWSFDGANWVAEGAVTAAGVRGLTGVVNNGAVTLYGTTGAGTAAGGGSLYMFTDSTGPGAAISGTATVVATALANEAFRGITFVPAIVATTATSKVGSLVARQTSDSFNVSATFNSVNGPNVTSVDLFVSTNNGPFILYQTQTTGGAASGSVNFSFVGQDRNVYAFYSVAHDVNGGTEVKSTIEASTFVPDLHPPVTHVLASSSVSNGVFTLNWSGTDPDQNSGTPPGSIVTVSIFVEIDGGAAKLVGQFPAGTATGGVYSSSATYAAQGDGLSHNYAFYSIGVDDQGVTQAVPGSADVSFNSITFTAPLAAPSLVVNHGAAERSFVRNLDVNFNQSLLSSPPSSALTSLQAGLAGSQPGAFVEVEFYGENLTPTSPPLSALTIFGGGTATTVTLSGSDLSIDFGAKGITGTPTTATGDGWYALGVDPTGNPGNGQVFWLTFFRLLGDANGDGQVTGGVTTSGSDVNTVNAARGSSGAFLSGDVNGDGTVNVLDLSEASAAVGHSVGTVPPQNFPNFQIMAGKPGPGTATAITTAQVQASMPDAIAAWQKAGLNQAGVQQLQNVKVQVVDLGGNILGQELPGLIEINASAAGFGWNLSAANPAANQVELRTVLEHEMGHVLGLPDNNQAGDLMYIGLGLGAQRTPSAADMSALDQALRTVAVSNSESIASSLSANRIAAGNSPAQLNSAVELIFSQNVRSMATGPILQPSNTTVAPSNRGSTIGTALPVTASGASLLSQYVVSAPVKPAKNPPADDPGQDTLSNDEIQGLAVKPLMIR